MIDGLTPDVEKHDVNMDVEPYTGSPLRGGKKLQFNMILQKYPDIGELCRAFKKARKALGAKSSRSRYFSAITQNFNVQRLFPILWVDEGIELNEEMVDLLKGQLTNVLNLINILQWTFVGVGSAMFVLMLVWFFWARSKKSTNVEIMPTSKSVEGWSETS